MTVTWGCEILVLVADGGAWHGSQSFHQELKETFCTSEVVCSSWSVTLRELTYPIRGKEKSSSNMPWVWGYVSSQEGITSPYYILQWIFKMPGLAGRIFTTCMSKMVQHFVQSYFCFCEASSFSKWTFVWMQDDARTLGRRFLRSQFFAGPGNEMSYAFCEKETRTRSFRTCNDQHHRPKRWRMGAFLLVGEIIMPRLRCNAPEFSEVFEALPAISAAAAAAAFDAAGREELPISCRYWCLTVARPFPRRLAELASRATTLGAFGRWKPLTVGHLWKRPPRWYGAGGDSHTVDEAFRWDGPKKGGAFFFFVDPKKWIQMATSVWKWFSWDELVS